jgi:hypothetical protein
LVVSLQVMAVANGLGKRYKCAHCRCELLVTKGGDGTLTCHGAPMTEQQPKKLPSSD